MLNIIEQAAPPSIVLLERDPIAAGAADPVPGPEEVHQLVQNPHLLAELVVPDPAQDHVSPTQAATADSATIVFPGLRRRRPVRRGVDAVRNPGDLGPGELRNRPQENQSESAVQSIPAFLQPQTLSRFASAPKQNSAGL